MSQAEGAVYLITVCGNIDCNWQCYKQFGLMDKKQMKRLKDFGCFPKEFELTLEAMAMYEHFGFLR